MKTKNIERMAPPLADTALDLRDRYRPPDMPKIPELVTPRTRMRGHRKSDFEASARLWAEEEVVRYISRQPSNESDSWTRFLRYIGHWQVMGFGYWVVEDRDSGRFLGEIGFADFKRGIAAELDGLAEIGWVLMPHAHGRGIATECVAAALAWGDRELPANSTFCILAPEHATSKRVAEKSGYRETGTMRYQDAPILVMQRRHPALGDQTAG